jgi:phosphate starvation-inducible PhoH-like protein
LEQTPAPAQITLVLASNEEAVQLLGNRDENLRAIEKQFTARILARGNELHIEGSPEQVEKVNALLGELLRLIRRGHPINRAEVEFAARRISQQNAPASESLFADAVLISDRGKPVKPRTPMQREYIEALTKYDMTFAIGPAGTGKTYLAMACAVAALKRKEVSRLILTRPALEAGERLGFLPGDIQAKVDPYLRPLFDALYDMMEGEKAQHLIEKGVIEVAPLAFMRGRTLNDSFIILDEAQNTTREQMKMFLTRLGFGSKAAVTGDITQTDLPAGQMSGLSHVRGLLAGLPGLAFIHFSDADVVRHDLVQAIIQAYEREGAGK